MLIDFSKMSSKSRVWVYQSDRKISPEEIHTITVQLIDFCNDWTSHGKPVFSSFKLTSWFIIVFIDETEYTTSGCSIDKSVLFIKAICKQYAIDFFNRFRIVFIDNNKTKTLPLSKFKNIISPDIIIYNTLIKTKLDFETEWKLPVKETWLNKFIK